VQGVDVLNGDFGSQVIMPKTWNHVEQTLNVITISWMTANPPSSMLTLHGNDP
jgi:hypothetical protein